MSWKEKLKRLLGLEIHPVAVYTTHNADALVVVVGRHWWHGLVRAPSFATPKDKLLIPGASNGSLPDEVVAAAYKKFLSEQPTVIRIVPFLHTQDPEVAHAVTILAQALRNDPSFASGLHASVAMAMVNEGVKLTTAQRGALRFLRKWTDLPAAAG